MTQRPEADSTGQSQGMLFSMANATGGTHLSVWSHCVVPVCRAKSEYKHCFIVQHTRDGQLLYCEEVFAEFDKVY